MKTNKKHYVSPETLVIDFRPEGLICGSDVETSGMTMPFVNPFGDTTEQQLS